MLMASDLDDPITDAAMVLQLTTHMAVIGMINRSVTKFNRQVKPEKKHGRQPRSGSVAT